MNNIYDTQAFFDEYAKMVRSQGGLDAAGEWPQMKLLFDNLTNKTVLDLGCGYGWHSKYMANSAKQVIAIDGSHKMIERAKQINQDDKINYQVCNLLSYEYPKDRFDFVISNLVLHYIEDLDYIYKKIYQTLKTNGSFVFNIEHPSYTSGIYQDFIYDENGNSLYWPIDNYYKPGLRETNFLGQKVYKYHHTLTQILNGLLKAGFKIEVVEEVVPTDDVVEKYGWYDELRRPMMLLVKARKE